MNQHPLHTAGDFTAPISVFLNLTRQCNLRCVYCASETVPPRRDAASELSDDEMLALADRLIEAHVFRYAITGGEPLLRRELAFALMEKLMPVGQVSMYTNGTLLSREDARRMGRLPARLSVYLSADAPSEELNATTRGRNVLAKVLRAIGYLSAEGVKVNVNCVVNRTNFERLPELADLLEAHGADELHLIRLQPVGYATRRPDLLLGPDGQRAAWKKVAEMEAEERKLKLRPADLLYWEGFEESFAGLNGRTSRQVPTLLSCSAGKDQCAITAEGDLVPCNFMMDYPCGNVRRQDVIDIWQRSERLLALRALRRTPVTSVPECADCRFNSFCPGGCRAVALAATGSLTGCDTSCIYMQQATSAQPQTLLPVVA